MRAVSDACMLLAGSVLMLAGCSFKDVTAPPAYAEQPLYSLCGHGRPLTLSNRGQYESRLGMGEVLLAGQLSTQPVENFLSYSAVRLEYLPDAGLQVTLISPFGAELVELLPAAWIHCAGDAMEVKLPSDAFYIWASVGVKTRRLRLQVTADDSLVLRHLWEEKGMMAIMLPVRIGGDGWSIFQADEAAKYGVQPAPALVAQRGECQDLGGTYSMVGESVRLDGSLERRTAEAQFFRPEIMGDRALPAEGWNPVGLEISHEPDGAIVLALLRDDGSRLDRRIDAAQVDCTEGRWLLAGEKDWSSPWLLLFGSGGATWEDLVLWRDGEGALMVRGAFQSRAVVYLIPVGDISSEIFIRYELLDASPSSPGNS